MRFQKVLEVGPAFFLYRTQCILYFILSPPKINARNRRCHYCRGQICCAFCYRIPKTITVSAFPVGQHALKYVGVFFFQKCVEPEGTLLLLQDTICCARLLKSEHALITLLESGVFCNPFSERSRTIIT